MHTCSLIPIEELSVGQIGVLRKLCLVKLTALIELHKAKSNVYVITYHHITHTITHTPSHSHHTYHHTPITHTPSHSHHTYHHTPTTHPITLNTIVTSCFDNLTYLSLPSARILKGRKPKLPDCKSKLFDPMLITVQLGD